MEIAETRMEILWRDKARRELKAVYDYLSKKNLSAAEEMYMTLLAAAEPLRIFPLMGAIEPLSEGHSREYRYLVVRKNYKLIYTIEAEIIYIITVWDCRQAPAKLRQSFH